MPFPEAEGGFSDDPGYKGDAKVQWQLFCTKCGWVGLWQAAIRGEVGHYNKTIDSNRKKTHNV